MSYADSNASIGNTNTITAFFDSRTDADHAVSVSSTPGFPATASA